MSYCCFSSVMQVLLRNIKAFNYTSQYDGQTLYINGYGYGYDPNFNGHDYENVASDLNWSIALGRAGAGVRASVTRNGNDYFMIYDYAVFDCYDWDIDNTTPFIPGIPDYNLFMLNNTGKAKSYYILSTKAGTKEWSK